MSTSTRPESLREARRSDRVTSRRQQLREAVELRDNANRTIMATVAGLRRDGVSWGEIASIVGVSRQAAQQRFDNKS